MARTEIQNLPFEQTLDTDSLQRVRGGAGTGATYGKLVKIDFCKSSLALDPNIAAAVDSFVKI